MSETDRHEMRDGHVVIYKREGSPNFQMRLRIDGNKGYVIRSTKRKSQDEAIHVALDTYETLKFKLKQGLEIKANTFRDIWKRYSETRLNHLSEHRQKYIRGTANRYLLPFFGDASTEALTSAKIQSYWDWRINYWSSTDGEAKIAKAQNSRTTKNRPFKQKLGNVSKLPSPVTLRMEQAVLRQIFGWAHEIGLISKMPAITAPKQTGPNVVSRRPGFDVEEWRKLMRFLREWVNTEPRNAMDDKRPTSFHIWHRALIRNYILFMGNSGLRPNEARQLKWRDLEWINPKKGGSYMVLNIAPTTKRGFRKTIPSKPAEGFLLGVKSMSQHNGPNDLVFCDRDGKPIENFGKTFKSILKQCDLLNDSFGRARTIYSLRHFYATSKLIYGNISIEDLARNMGTSPTQIYRHYSHVTVIDRAEELSGKRIAELSQKGLIF
jgi:integrase